MTGINWIYLGASVILLTLLAPLLGAYIKTVLSGKGLLAPIETVFFKLAGINPDAGQNWWQYTLNMLMFNGLGLLFLYIILRLQGNLPFNPQGFAGVEPTLAFNAAVSFVTNTNWQAFSGEQTLSQFSQAVGLGVQNFLSAATGISLLLAVIRGISARQVKKLGNYWVDMVRSTVYVLLPLSLIFSLVLIAQGVLQNTNVYTVAQTFEKEEQIIPQGPVASQVAIRQLGTNGGGFFGVNAAHPFENPTPISNFLQFFSILLIPAALCFTYGRMVGDKRQGATLYSVMLGLWLMGTVIALYAEGNNVEGKDTRFGVTESVVWATATTAASNGSTNAMHGSLTPISGLVTIFNMQLGEVVFGGVGSGLYGMLSFVILTVFLAGLMVGRTPEFLGKKIEAREIKLVVLTMLILPIGVLIGGAIALLTGDAQSSMLSKGPHGLSELLYAYTSATANNGSAFGGFMGNTPFHNIALGVCMLLGRYGYVVPLMALAGSLAEKKTIPATAGTFPTHGVLFGVLLTGIIGIVGGLTFFPVLTLGPLAEHFGMIVGQKF
ncbi:MAG: potassium-transporting ATPase subunit KdpA [Holosporales bacterium]